MSFWLGRIGKKMSKRSRLLKRYKAAMTDIITITEQMSKLKEDDAEWVYIRLTKSQKKFEAKMDNIQKTAEAIWAKQVEDANTETKTT